MKKWNRSLKPPLITSNHRKPKNQFPPKKNLSPPKKKHFHQNTCFHQKKHVFTKKHDLIKKTMFSTINMDSQKTHFDKKNSLPKNMFSLKKCFYQITFFLSIQEFGTDCLGLVYQKFGDCLFLR